MAACFLVDVREIKDSAKREYYKARVGAVVGKFGGRNAVIGGPFQVVEGSYEHMFTVMIEFPGMQEARRWYDSDEYRELKALRLASTVSNAFFMEGTPSSR